MRRFRVRVFALIVLVALVATGATAWLTVRATTAQIAESAAVEKRTADLIYGTLDGYGRLHGTWEGVDRSVKGLGERTGQRIRLTTLDGVVIADTDVLNGRAARPLSTRPATIVDARPQPAAQPADVPADPRQSVLTPPGTAPDGTGGEDEGGPATLFPAGIEDQIAGHRSAFRLAACLTRAGVPIARQPTAKSGWWAVYPTGAADQATIAECEQRARGSEGERIADARAVGLCMRPRVREPSTPQPSRRHCVEQAFADRLEAVAPVALQLKLGFGKDRARPARIDPRRVLTAAGVVAFLVIASTVLLSRRMLSSVAEVSQASRRLGAGDLSGRVKVRGDDEIADLATAFNRMADSLQRSEERQRRMINDIAHELRTPLANIRGYLEALHDGVLPPGRELFASLHEEAVLQQRLIDDLQELALAESGGLVLHRVPVDAAELLETCRTAHRANADTAGVSLRVQVRDPGPVVADPDRVRQAIGNLVTNALRATPRGGSVTLRASAVSDGARGTGGTAIEVADTGHGIAAEDLRNVFDRFWRADGARGRDTGGRGLGLAIAREIVLAHGGTLTAESTPGAGSRFVIVLPAPR